VYKGFSNFSPTARMVLASIPERPPPVLAANIYALKVRMSILFEYNTKDECSGAAPV
jgi:hypothetical protein